MTQTHPPQIDFLQAASHNERAITPQCDRTTPLADTSVGRGEGEGDGTTIIVSPTYSVRLLALLLPLPGPIDLASRPSYDILSRMAAKTKESVSPLAHVKGWVI